LLFFVERRYGVKSQRGEYVEVLESTHNDCGLVDAAALAMQVDPALGPFAIDSVRSNGIVSDWNRLAYLLQLLGLAVIASEYLPQRVPQDTARSGKGLKGDKEG
jgi:hypothetical protein